MSTLDVPGFNPANNDVLAAGCWAEHDDGSLIYVKGTEGGQVVYEIYDTAQDPPVFYQDAMLDVEFKKQFSWVPGDLQSKDKWLWHDKTPFDWGRVMKLFNDPVPQHADVRDQLTAAERVAESLKLRRQQLNKSDVESKMDVITKKGKSILNRIMKAVEAFNE